MNHIQGFLGINLFPGYLVAYPTRQGSSMEMNIGKIVEVGEKDNVWRDEKVPYARVQTLSRYGGEWDAVAKRRLPALGKIVDTIAVWRMLPVAWDDIPLEIARLFDPTFGMDGDFRVASFIDLPEIQ